MRALALLLIIPMLAGCASNDAPPVEQEDPIATQQSSAGQQLNATTQDGNFTSAADADAYLLPGLAGPEKPLRSFHWRVPDGALVPHEFISEWELLILDVELRPSTTVTEWGVLVFQTEGNGATLIGSAFGADLHATTKLAVLPTDASIPVNTDPFFLQVGINSVQEGDRLTFVVYAESAEAGEFNVGFRVMDHDPEYDESPSGDVLNGAVAEMLVAAEGAGAQIAIYTDLNALGAIGVELWTDAVTVEDRIPVDLRPTATVRDVSLSASFDQSGWSTGAGAYIGYESHGTWEATLNVHGLQDEMRSLIAQDWVPAYTLLAEIILFGLPIYAYESSGEGPAEHNLDILVTNANYIELMLFQQVDLGATLKELTGKSGQSYSVAFTGLVGNVPPTYVERQGDDLVIQGQVPMTLPGYFA